MQLELLPRDGGWEGGGDSLSCVAWEGWIDQVLAGVWALQVARGRQERARLVTALTHPLPGVWPVPPSPSSSLGGLDVVESQAWSLAFLLCPPQLITHPGVKQSTGPQPHGHWLGWPHYHFLMPPAAEQPCRSLPAQAPQPLHLPHRASPR